MISDTLVSVIDALPFPVLVIGPDERIHAGNDPAEMVLGGHIVGHRYIAVLRQPALLDAIAAVQAGEGAITTRFTGRDGTKDTVYRVVVAPAAADIVLSFEDQTAAEEAGQMRRDFVANVSHELRTPLTALLGFIETLSGAARDDAAARARFLEIMQQEASRMTRLVDDLLSLSRVEEDERVRPREQVDLALVLSSVIKALQPQSEKAGVRVELQLDEQAQMVPGDAGQLMQIFTNLIENGIKYGAAGSCVVVTLYGPEHHTRLRAEGVQVTVADKGDGIASHHIARLTERFYRVDNHRSREVGGTGLGLAIVKHIVNRHRGRLIIESEVGQGTDVSVFLPTQ